jgi:hypothetical protein
MIYDKIYIHSSSCISAQDTFADRRWSNNIRRPDDGIFRCVEPDYRTLIEPETLRRMNRIQRFGLAVALTAQRAVDLPIDAIIMATGWGCIDSTYRIIERIYDGKELPVNPAAFVQSLHNAIAAQTAAYLKSKVYNNTFTDNRVAFELAMDNAVVCLLGGDNFRTILLGACDEIIPPLIDIFGRISKFGILRPCGEGGAAFILSKNEENSCAELRYFRSVETKSILTTVKRLAKNYAVDYIFSVDKRDYCETVPVICYSDYFGDFPTVSACGFWLALDAVISEMDAIPNAKNIMLISDDHYSNTFITIVGQLKIEN